MQLVQIKNLNFKLNDTQILNKIDLCIQSNEKILLAGANGAGKSTLLRLIAGLHIVRTYEEFNILGDKIPQDQCNGLAYLGNKWERSISFGGTTPYIADIKVKTKERTALTGFLEVITKILPKRVMKERAINKKLKPIIKKFLKIQHKLCCLLWTRTNQL